MKLQALISLLLVSTFCFANEIDALKTNHDVNRFLAKKVFPYFKKNPPLAEPPDTVRHEKGGRDRFFKIDLDGNGLTDLVVYGNEEFFIVSDNGKGRYPVNYLSNGAFTLNKATLISIDSISRPKKIVIQQRQRPANHPDTLVSMFGGIVEYNSSPAKNFTFEKITFAAGGCFGTCPVFNLSINKDGTATYSAIEYNEKTGNFTGKISQPEFDELMELLRYLNPDELNNNYRVGWTDDETGTTEIDYNGRSKTISDYGEIGTYGLAALYAKFLAWRNSVDWSK